MKKVLIYGYGNPGRQDDALGVLLADRMEEWANENNMSSMSFDSNYQLNIEDALAISEYDLILFADASIEEIRDFKVTRVKPSQKTEFTMHAMSPEFILHLCQSLYNKFPNTYLIHMKGYEFDFLGELTQKAGENLDLVMKFLTGLFSGSAFPIDKLDQAVQDQEQEIKICLS